MPDAQYLTKTKTALKIGSPQAGTVTSLAIAEDEEDIIFIGTILGLFRSTNKSISQNYTWERLSQAPLGIICLAISPNFARDHTLLVGTNHGLFISQNSGETWSHVQLPHDQATILCINLSPDFQFDGVIIAGTLEDGIFYSDSRGDKWERRCFGLLDLTIHTIAFSPGFSQNDVIFIGTETALYYTYNRARAWRQLDFPEEAAPILSLALSITNSGIHIIFAGTEDNGLFRSKDNGIKWQKLEFPAETVNALATLNTSNELWAATESGLFFSVGQSYDWKNALGISTALGIATQGELIIAGLAERGAWWSLGGTHWEPVPNLSVGAFNKLLLSDHFQQDRIAFVFGALEGVWITKDGGHSWEPINKGLPCNDIIDFYISPRYSIDHALIITSQSGVVIGSESGDQWSFLDERTPDQVTFSPDSTLLVVNYPGEGLIEYENWLFLENQIGNRVLGPWDAGGNILVLSVDNNRYYRVAIWDENSGSLDIWQGKSGQFKRVLHYQIEQPQVVSFWVPEESLTDSTWFLSLGKEIWKIDAQSAIIFSQLEEFEFITPSETIISLAGTAEQDRYHLVVCTGKHIYQCTYSKSWTMTHDFGEERVISMALSHSYEKIDTYILLLGGTFAQLV